MLTFHGISAALLKRVSSGGPKVFEQIEQYLEIAHLHLTGRYRVNNFLMFKGKAADNGAHAEVFLSFWPCMHFSSPSI